MPVAIAEMRTEEDGREWDRTRYYRRHPWPRRPASAPPLRLRAATEADQWVEGVWIGWVMEKDNGTNS